MTWDPDGIVVSDAFADYVEDLRETSNYAAGGGNAHFSETMSATSADEGEQVETTAAADALNDPMNRRVFMAGVGAMAAAAAGAGTVSAQEAGLVPDFGNEYTPFPGVDAGRWRTDEHTADMEQLDYVDNDGNVRSLTSEYGAVLAPDPEEDGETHNPVSFHPSLIDTSEYTAFPRGVTRTTADDEEEDVSALDAEEWTGDLLISDDGDALVLESDALAAGASQSATFSNFTIDSGEARKVLQLVVDVDQLEAGATVDVEVVDAGGASVAATIDPDADGAAASTIATSQGSGVVFQTEIGEFPDGSTLDTLEEIVVSVSDANAALTVHGLNLELDSEWSFGTRQVYDTGDEEVVEETLVEPTGRTGIVSLTSLTNQFTDATLGDVEYDVEIRASEAPVSNFEVTVEEVERGSYDQRYHLVGALELPGGLYEVEVVEPGELTDEVRHPEDVYRTVEYAHDLTEVPTMDDLDDISWTDATSVLEDADIGDEVTLSTTVSAGDTIGLHYDLTEDEEIVSAMSMSAGGGGAPALGGSGGVMSNLWGWAAAIVTGFVGAIALARRRAASAVGR
ncbi:hypothetical protein [Halorubrum sp. DTA46]|uniref:hypothetical protein n=1 Tax=Halorubrum sp. DTA46 TaxID=3402162 RepID=UPI003AAABDCB